MRDYIEWITENRVTFDYDEIIKLHKVSKDIIEKYGSYQSKQLEKFYVDIKPVINYRKSRKLDKMYKYYDALANVDSILLKKHFGNKALPGERLRELSENIKLADDIINSLQLDDKKLLYEADYKKLKEIPLFLPNEGFINAEYYFIRYYLKSKKIAGYFKPKFDITAISNNEKKRFQYDDLYEDIYNDILIENKILDYDERGNLCLVDVNYEEDFEAKEEFKKKVSKRIDRIKETLSLKLNIDCSWHYKKERFNFLKFLKLIYNYNLQKKIATQLKKVCQKKVKK